LIFKENFSTQKGTIVCIHGNSSSLNVFNSLLNADIEHRVIAVDLPGHNNAATTELPTENLYDFYKSELIQFINALEDSIILIGNSLGGHLAVEIAPSINQLKGLVIMGTPPVKSPINFEEAFIPMEALNTFLQENPSGTAIKEAANVAVYNKTNAEAIVKDFNSCNPKIRALIAADIMGNKLSDEYTIFKTLPIKKYILKGMQDPTVNPNYLAQLQQECKTTCEIVEINQCGHYPSLEQPELFVQIIQNIAKTNF
jgi:pimeloyl-ACP methyl ester carboxylesterase